MSSYGWTIFTGTLMGFLARVFMLRSDYRRYPGYPHGQVIHLSLGFIAAVMGAVAVPALAAKEFTAVTFLALAAQQFREVRSMERESLGSLEDRQLVPRGMEYVEGIARVFEARNYLTILVALVASLAGFFWGPAAGVAAGALAFLAVALLMQGETVGRIAEVLPARPAFDGPVLKVEGVPLLNVGLETSREKLLREGIACVVRPRDDNARLTLHDVGQRQAILHTAATLLGTKAEVGEPEWTPICRKNIDQGYLVVFILANEPDEECLLEAVRRTPVLESAQRRPLATRAGRVAAD